MRGEKEEKEEDKEEEEKEEQREEGEEEEGGGEWGGWFADRMTRISRGESGETRELLAFLYPFVKTCPTRILYIIKSHEEKVNERKILRIKKQEITYKQHIHIQETWRKMK